MVKKTTGKKEKSPSVTGEKAMWDIPESKNHIPTENDIRLLAEILYNHRIDRNEPGSATEDWLKAESYLRFPDN